MPSSVHAVPLAFFASAGQFGPVPGQVSARSHSPAAARQVKVDDWKASLGHVLLLPVHVSATSQPPDVAARQTVPALPGLWTQRGLPTVPLQRSVVQTLPSSVQPVPDAFTVSFGHVELEPVQSSALSHSLDAARHVVPELPGLWTHNGFPDVPLHRSVVQTLPSSVHGVPDAFTVSFGQVELEPVQSSALSHSLEAARHVVPVLPGLWTQSGLPDVPLH